MKSLPKAVLVGTVIVALLCPRPASAQQVPISVEDIRRGGYVFLFQHAHVEVTPENQPLDPADCAAQRFLTAQGRADAVSIGETFRA